MDRLRTGVQFPPPPPFGFSCEVLAGHPTVFFNELNHLTWLERSWMIRKRMLNHLTRVLLAGLLRDFQTKSTDSILPNAV